MTVAKGDVSGRHWSVGSMEGDALVGDMAGPTVSPVPVAQLVTPGRVRIPLRRDHGAGRISAGLEGPVAGAPLSWAAHELQSGILGPEVAQLAVGRSQPAAGPGRWPIARATTRDEPEQDHHAGDGGGGGGLVAALGERRRNSGVVAIRQS